MVCNDKLLLTTQHHISRSNLVRVLKYVDDENDINKVSFAMYRSLLLVYNKCLLPELKYVDDENDINKVSFAIYRSLLLVYVYNMSLLLYMGLVCLYIIGLFCLYTGLFCLYIIGLICLYLGLFCLYIIRLFSCI